VPSHHFFHLYREEDMVPFNKVKMMISVCTRSTSWVRFW